MSRYHGNDQACPVCGLRYGKFRTGHTYQEVYDLMKDNSDDPADWKYKRRNTVLGYWFQLKQELWEHHLDQCHRQQQYEADVAAGLVNPDEEVGDAWVGDPAPDDTGGDPWDLPPDPMVDGVPF